MKVSRFGDNLCLRATSLWSLWSQEITEKVYHFANFADLQAEKLSRLREC